MEERTIPMGPDDQKNPEGKAVGLNNEIIKISARMREQQTGFGSLPDQIESGNAGDETIQKMALDFKSALERARAGLATKADLVLALMYEDKVAEIHKKMLEAGFLRG